MEKLPLRRNQRLQASVQHMRTVLQTAVDQRLERWREDVRVGRRPSFEQPRDLLDMILPPPLGPADADGPTGHTLEPPQLLPNLWLFFLAGHDTTAISLAWTLHLLSKYPEAQAKAREEAVRVLGRGGTPTAEQLEQLPYISNVVNESLRLYPPVHNIPTRYAAEDTTLDGHSIPKGTLISIGIGAINRHPALWDEPHRFRPERFDERPKGFSFLPFSAGPRRCLGDRFSLMEQKTLLSMLLTRFELSPAKAIPHDADERLGAAGFSGESIPLTFTQPADVRLRLRTLTHRI
jgi:cytochrome P450